MPFQDKAATLALLSMIAAPVPAWAFGAGAGCADLPEYARAQGALEGMTGACDMSVERARQVIAAQDGPAAAYGQPAPVARPHHRRHKVRVVQPE